MLDKNLRKDVKKRKLFKKVLKKKKIAPRAKNKWELKIKKKKSYLFYLCGMVGLSWGPQELLLSWMNSLVVVCGLSCSVACGILVPGPEMEPVSPALQGRFVATRPPGKSPQIHS